MPRIRKSHPPNLKARVAVQAIKGHRTITQIAQIFGVHPTQIGGWKKQALAGLPEIFSNGQEHLCQQVEAEKDELYKQIGQLKVELDFLKKGWSHHLNNVAHLDRPATFRSEYPTAMRTAGVAPLDLLLLPTAAAWRSCSG